MNKCYRKSILLLSIVYNTFTTTAFVIKSPIQSFTFTPSSTPVSTSNPYHNNNNNNNNSINHNNKSTKLYDLSEWRDQFFQVPTEVDQAASTISSNTSTNNNNDNEPIRQICVLPFPLDDVLLQGETKELCLYEDRFHKLFEMSTTKHNSVVAMGLLAPPAGILQTMPLCDIENYRVMKGKTAFGTDYSILVTIRVVGRASLIYVQDDDDEDVEFLKGWCTEMNDDNMGKDSDNVLKVCNRIADRIDDLIAEIQVMEDALVSSSSSSISLMDDDDDDDFDNDDDQVLSGRDKSVSDATMRRRILEAELVSTYEYNHYLSVILYSVIRVKRS